MNRKPKRKQTIALRFLIVLGVASAILWVMAGSPFAAKGKDRRSEQRYPLFASATYATSTGEFSSETRNISSGGVYLRCQGPLLSVGARFPVTLHLEGEHSRGVKLNGRVAWLDLFEESKGMGVIFDQGQSGIKQVQRAIKRISRDLKRLGA